MREFESLDGERWVAEVEERPGTDYKGRFLLRFRRPSDGAVVRLTDVRWNGVPTAARTLSTLSDLELAKRLRSALRRNGTAPAL